MTKRTKIFFTICIPTLVSVTIYAWLHLKSEEWQTRERCAECALSEHEEMQRLTGTIERQSNNKMFITEQQTGILYSLTPCDVKCDNSLNQWFEKTGFNDFSTRAPLYFDIEGKSDTTQKDFLLISVVLLGTGKELQKTNEN